MDRYSTNPREASAALGPQTRELTDAELDAVSGGAIMVEKPTASIQWSGSGGAGDSPMEIIAVL